MKQYKYDKCYKCGGYAYSNGLCSQCLRELQNEPRINKA